LRYNHYVHIVSRRTMRQFWEKYPDSEKALLRWFKIVKNSTYINFGELRATFPSADKVGSYIVFNIGGNKYRLITVFHFNLDKVYIRHILTHQEYDKGA